MAIHGSEEILPAMIRKLGPNTPVSLTVLDSFSGVSADGVLLPTARLLNAQEVSHVSTIVKAGQADVPAVPEIAKLKLAHSCALEAVLLVSGRAGGKNSDARLDRGFSTRSGHRNSDLDPTYSWKPTEGLPVVATNGHSLLRMATDNLIEVFTEGFRGFQNVLHTSYWQDGVVGDKIFISTHPPNAMNKAEVALAVKLYGLRAPERHAVGGSRAAKAENEARLSLVGLFDGLPRTAAAFLAINEVLPGSVSCETLLHRKRFLGNPRHGDDGALLGLIGVLGWELESLEKKTMAGRKKFHVVLTAVTKMPPIIYSLLDVAHEQCASSGYLHPALYPGGDPEAVSMEQVPALYGQSFPSVMNGKIPTTISMLLNAEQLRSLGLKGRCTAEMNRTQVSSGSMTVAKMAGKIYSRGLNDGSDAGYDSDTSLECTIQSNRLRKAKKYPAGLLAVKASLLKPGRGKSGTACTTEYLIPTVVSRPTPRSVYFGGKRPRPSVGPPKFPTDEESMKRARGWASCRGKRGTAAQAKACVRWPSEGS